MKFDQKVRDKEDVFFVKKYWLEKENMVNKEFYSTERESYYNYKGWNIEAIEGMKYEGLNIESSLRERELDIQRQLEDAKIRDARYNKRYKVLEMGNTKPNFLRKEILDRYMYSDEIRALLKIRCGNLEENNKYW